jgi:hypothetical protein
MALLGLEGSKPSRSTWRPGDRSLFRPILSITLDPSTRAVGEQHDDAFRLSRQIRSQAFL